MNKSTDPQFKTAVPYEFDCLQTDIKFSIQDDTIPSAPRLIIGSKHGYICQTGMLHKDNPKKVAEAMIAAARRLYKFTDAEILDIKPQPTFWEKLSRGDVDTFKINGSMSSQNLHLL